MNGPDSSVRKSPRHSIKAGLMVLELEFTNVGSYRRALSSSDVKMRAVEFPVDGNRRAKRL